MAFESPTIGRPQAPPLSPSLIPTRKEGTIIHAATDLHQPPGLSLIHILRVFAAKSGELRRVVAAVDDAMSVLGYELTFRWEEPGEGWRQTAMRYRIYL